MSDSLWKPDSICTKPELEGFSSSKFYVEKKKMLDDKFMEMGLYARSLLKHDTEPLMKFARRYYYGNTLLSPLLLYHVTSFGSSTLLLDNNNEIKGYILEVTYINGISHGASMAVHPALSGHSIGADLFMYSSIIAMQKGATMKKAIISIDNYASIKSIINRSGGIAIRYCENLHGMKRKLIINIPLVPEILSMGTIDVKAALIAAKQDKNYELLKTTDIHEVTDQFDRQRVIVGLLNDYFLTYPSKDMNQNFLR